MKRYIFFVLIFSFLTISHTPDKRRQIITDDYNIDFYITYESHSNYDLNKEYYWYKNGEIQFSKGGANGYLLDGEYRKSYISQALVEKGGFKKGLKDGVWTTWHSNGKIDIIQNWNHGKRSGDFKSYSESGKLIATGKYTNNKKQGIWINHIKKDTIRFKKDSLFTPKPKKAKIKDDRKFTEKVKDFFKKAFTKKSKKSVKKKKPKNKKMKKSKVNSTKTKR